MGFMRGIGMPELLIILFIVLLVFGSTRLPKLAGSMGKAMKEFRKGVGAEDSTASNGHKRSRSKSSKTPSSKA